MSGRHQKDLLFTLLEVNDTFRADEGVTTQNSNNTGNSITLIVFCVRLGYCVELRAASRDLVRTNQRSINRTRKMKTYRINNVLILIQVLLVPLIVDHVTEPRGEVRVFETPVLRFQLIATIRAQMQRVFPSLQQQEVSTGNNSGGGHSYKPDFGKAIVFFPGRGQAGHTTAILPSGGNPTAAESFTVLPFGSGPTAGESSAALPSGGDLSGGERCMAPPRLRSWRWVQRRMTSVISL